MSIHATAVIDPSAVLGEGVSIGPYAIVGAEVTIGDGTEVGASAHIEGPTSIGSANRIFPHACIGFDPQDLKFEGERVTLDIGDRNVFREFSTVNRGTGKGGGRTSIGSDGLFMAYAHIAHDCFVGDRTVFSNGATLAGHVEVADDAVVGAFSAVHQFCRVGKHAYIGGFSVVTMDALPFVKTVGHKPACFGLNRVGLKRKGLDEDALRHLESAYRMLTRPGLNTSQALEKMRQEHADSDEVLYFAEFVESSGRGVIKALPGRRRARGGQSED